MGKDSSQEDIQNKEARGALLLPQNHTHFFGGCLQSPGAGGWGAPRWELCWGQKVEMQEMGVSARDSP